MTGPLNLLRSGRARLTSYVHLVVQMSRGWIAIGFVIGCTVGFAPVAILGVLSLNSTTVEPTAVEETIAFAPEVEANVEPETSMANGDSDLTATAVAEETVTTSIEMTPIEAPTEVPVPTPIPVPTATPLPAVVDGRFAVLLMGFGGTGHDGAYLTDSLIVVVVDTPKKSVTIVSVPRDSWVPMMFDGKSASYNKINTAYAMGKDPTIYPGRLPRYNGEKGAGAFAADTVSRIVGIPIQYYMGIDFAGFRDMIDAVGGVDVDVTEAFASLYPANDNPSIDPSYITVRFAKGPQKMNGMRAIQFARARQTIDSSNEGSDFARSRRQRLIMEAFKNRLMQPDAILHLPQLFLIASKHIDTNYDFPGISRIGQLLADWKSIEVYQAALTNGNYLEEATGPQGAFILIPTAPNHSWSQIQALGRNLWENPAQAIAMADSQIVVVNRTGQAGVGSQLSTMLSQFGYRTSYPVTGTTTSETRLLTRPGTATTSLAARLASDLQLSSLPVLSSEDLAKGEYRLELGSRDMRIAETVLPSEWTTELSSNIGVVRYAGWVSDNSPEYAPKPTVRPASTTQTPQAITSRTPVASTPGAGGTTTAGGTPVHSSGTPVTGAIPTQPAVGTPILVPGKNARPPSPSAPVRISPAASTKT